MQDRNPIIDYAKPSVPQPYPIRNVIVPLLLFVVCFLAFTTAFAWMMLHRR